MQTHTVSKTWLYEDHAKRGGKLIDFAGFELPVWFSNLKDEHLAVRRSAGAFDISHMGPLRVTGADAYAFLKTITCNQVDRAMDKMIYSMVLNEKGMVLDDIMFGKCDDGFYVIVNASNKTKILNWFDAHKTGDVQVRDLSLDHGFIAIQGPEAAEKLSRLFDQDLTSPKRFSVQHRTVMGVPVTAMRTGYTGEDGYEMIVHKDQISKIWNAVLDSGIQPCGLGARDSLRMEYGLPLYGQELSESIHPLQTRYTWVVKMDHDFIGKAALEACQTQTPALVAVGIEMQGKEIPRTHYAIKEGGEVTSGTMSPSLNKPIGLAFVKPEFSALGSIVHVMIRGKECPARVTEVPFIKK